MLRLNEVMVTRDPALALENESGVFEVVSPRGEKFQIVARVGHSITNLRYVPDTGRTPQEWFIRKVAELRTEQEAVGSIG
ncbi:MAG: hypothetical protein V3R29_03980 [Candidatus Acidoferrales bacterium]